MQTSAAHHFASDRLNECVHRNRALLHFRSGSACKKSQVPCRNKPICPTQMENMPAAPSVTGVERPWGKGTSHCPGAWGGGGDRQYLNPRRRKCLLPSLVIAFLATSSRLRDPSSFTATDRILPLGTAFKYWARRSLSFLYV